MNVWFSSISHSLDICVWYLKLSQTFTDITINYLLIHNSINPLKPTACNVKNKFFLNINQARIIRKPILVYSLFLKFNIKIKKENYIDPNTLLIDKLLFFKFFKNIYYLKIFYKWDFENLFFWIPFLIVFAI